MTQDRAEATRRRLLDATVAALRVHGTAGLTSREITRAAGVNLQAITYHFGSKDELVAQALTGLVTERIAPVRAALDTDGDPAERLFAALRTIGGTFAVARDDLAAYASAVAASSSNPTLAGALRDLHAELVDYLATLMAQMQDDGYIQAWVRPRAMAEVLISIGDGVAMQAHYGEPDVDGVLDQVALLLLAARDQRSRVWPAAARALLRQARKG
ncbi:TetR/AcrR family transcriptional regulator [Isoptericola sp. NPDC056605]|uniref:TetR/AcrR family transcriptional regulator n=1 Tax=Isoptericola sp. NPDC056605 TaxID=3345876 RepID=UPI0036D18DDC